MRGYRVIEEPERFLIEVTYPSGIKQVEFVCETRSAVEQWITERLIEDNQRPSAGHP